MCERERASERKKEASEWERENLREFVYDMYAVRERERERDWVRSVGDSQRERERERGDITQHMYATKQCVRLFEHAIPNTVLCFGF